MANKWTIAQSITAVRVSMRSTTSRQQPVTTYCTKYQQYMPQPLQHGCSSLHSSLMARVRTISSHCRGITVDTLISCCLEVFFLCIKHCTKLGHVRFVLKHFTLKFHLTLILTLNDLELTFKSLTTPLKFLLVRSCIN